VFFPNIAKEEAKGVSVTGDRFIADPLLSTEELNEEFL
jgi:hypothetical protein